MAISRFYTALEAETDDALTQEYMRVIEALNELAHDATVFRDDEAILEEEARLNARAYDLHLEVCRRKRLRVPLPEGAHV